MKKIITVFLIMIASVASAQWTNTTNQFFDTLHTPVCTAVKTQKSPFILNSYPDGGYFVIWEDDRNTATTNTDIYAQKYDKAGKQLWADNGVPVVNGPNAQRYAFSSNQDYRNRSFAATDSAGGFYITYIDDSISTYSWERIAVQHMRSSGSAVFANPGYIVAQTPAAQSYTFSQPFLIADGNKGFYISYKNTYGNDYIYVYNYKDINGVMTSYGGGTANENAIQTIVPAPCGIKTDIVYPGTTVLDYNIWPDGQGGCNIIMSMNGNTGSQYKMLCYNRVWRAKKDAVVKSYFRNTMSIACPKYTSYKKGNVYMLYVISQDFYYVTCGGSSGPLYEYTNYRLLSNGYQVIDQGGYDYNFPKGITIATPGDINVDLIAVTKRTNVNNTVSDFTVQGFSYPSEKFDSVPYQRASFLDPELGFNPKPPLLNKLNFFRDTLLAPGRYYYDFSLAGGGSEIYSSALIWENDGSSFSERKVRLQHLSVEQKTPDSLALVYKTNKSGELIGREISTNFSGSNISYDFPLVTVNPSGKAVFCIREYYRSARVSPITGNAELAWGAMGKPVGTGVYNNSYYNLEQPFVSIDTSNGTGLIAWQDNKNIPGTTAENIFMRHLDKLDVFKYLPPDKPIKLLPNPYGSTPANPAVLYGTSKQYTTLEVYDSYGSNPGTSPAAAILDKYNLGSVSLQVFQNSGVIRKYNNQAYLDRNITIKTESNPPGANIDLLLYFTKEEFDALKKADYTIADPGFLAVVKQPSVNSTAPPVYTPTAGEEVITPVTWDSVPGGYYLKITVTTGFGNFFIQKIASVNLCNAGSTTFSSDVAGAAYQWQVNSGTNFFDIADNSNYSGAKTATLHLNNVPSSFNGNRYRCVIDAAKVSKSFYLQMANSWTGAVSNAWENPANWGCGAVPDANTDVVLGAAAVVILNSNASCRSLIATPGSKFTIVPPYTLTVTH